MPGMGMDHGGHGWHERHGYGRHVGRRIAGWQRRAAGRTPATPKGMRVLSYADLKSLTPQKDTRAPDREIVVRLGGNMERYIWTINGKKFEDAEPINLRYGERVKLTFVNETMMAHPMHLHGMFVQLDNGQPAERLPDKHVVNVPPGRSYSVLLTADETWRMGVPLPPALSHGIRDDDQGRRRAHDRRGRAMKPRHISLLAIAAVLATHPAAAMEGDDAHRVFHLVRAEIDWTKVDREDLVTWDFRGWLGGDRNKAWFRTEGKVRDGHVKEAELWALYSRNVATYWDVQAGAREDFEPRSTTYAVIGVTGLAPYFFETDAHLFVSHRGDVTARLEQSYDLLITQRLIAQPHLELEFFGPGCAGAGVRRRAQHRRSWPSAPLRNHPQARPLYRLQLCARRGRDRRIDACGR